MSAPDTNIERQAERHWVSITGICVALTLGVVIGLGLASVIDLNGPQVSATDAQINGTVTSGD
ncbi:hypothetical protein So717_03240 [Roseobacter cerasinus]|uniref:Uncharacterized protein n=1 Tax=Roseobacter cerasinus TaxID=2602289 RepID=A0A640VNA4_9RHOB|nr:hypothetical protein [Roseobacter cerasinus]GFE48571.1 hypothetical protein So717_03240 [Roseobacter cerasinus]